MRVLVNRGLKFKDGGTAKQIVKYKKEKEASGMMYKVFFYLNGKLIGGEIQIPEMYWERAKQDILKK